MANLLYRLGRFSARRAWYVIVAWLLLLGGAGGAYVAFGGSLASTFSIPGTETERVNDVLSDAMPDAAGATGIVVFQTDGDVFTDDQKAAIGELLDEVADADGVADTVNPFTTADERADQEQQLADGRTQLEDGKTQLADARSQLDAAQQQLDDGQQQLDDAVAQAQAAGTYDQAKTQLDTQQQQIDAQQAQLDASAQELTENEQKLADSETELDNGEALLQAASEITTVSDDGATAVGTIAFDDDLFTLSETVKSQVATLLDDAGIDGVSIDYSSTIATSIDGILGVGEIVGVLIALIVLIVMMRALLPALTPLISSIVGVGVGVAGSLAFSGVVDMASVTPVLGVMLGLAVGIDYSLFILNRHRRQVLEGIDLDDSVGLANGTAGNAVVFAGTTVVVALVALLVSGIPFLGVMGIVGAVCVAISVLVSITLTPAILGLLGTRVVGRSQRRTIGHPDHAPKPLRAMSIPKTLGAAVLAIVALLTIAIPAMSMRLGLPDGSSEATDSTQYRAFKAIETEFGAGMNGALVVVAETPEAVADDDQTATEVDIVEQLMDQDNVSAVAPVGVSDDGTVFVFQVVPDDGPSSASTEDLVHTLRDLSPITVSGVDGDIDLGVAGVASGNIDVSEKLADALPLYLAVVIGLSLLIMVVVFRSILVPVIATAGYVLSLFAALGGVTAIYQWGWLSDLFGVHDPGPVLSFAPILIMGVLFGLAMDYQLFLVSGMREAYAHGVPARQAVVAGLRGGRAVVTAAAIIMASVFGGFIFSDLSMIRPIGLGLASGVLFDAFIVRMVIIPALMTVFGRAAWWLPKWLDRIIPNVDVEGAGLERTHPPHSAEGVDVVVGAADGDAVAGSLPRSGDGGLPRAKPIRNPRG